MDMYYLQWLQVDYLIFFIKISFGISTIASPSLGPLTESFPISSIQSVNSFTSFESELKQLVWSLTFFVKVSTLQKDQRYDKLMVARTISCLLPLGMTGRIYLKSPPSATILPPKGWCFLQSFHGA